MIEFWRKLQQQFFSYSRSDRNAVLILSVLIVFVIVVTRILPSIINPEPADFSEMKSIFEEWENEQLRNNSEPKLALFEFNPNTIGEAEMDSLDLPVFVKQNILRYREAGGSFEVPEDVSRIYGMNDSIFLVIKDYINIPDRERKVIDTKIPLAKTKQPSGTFDPNTASTERLVEFGLSDYQAGNLVSYRENGGTFRVPQDLLKIYGIDSAFFHKILVFVEIERVVESEKSKIEIEKIELNSADTSALMALPGIGSVYAARIIKYRDLLGGFYSVDQLLEVYNFPKETFERVSEFLVADTVKLKKLRVNFLDYSDLIRHPYLNKDHVEILLDTRNKNGAYKSLQDIDELEVFDSETFSRVRPYLTCR